MVVVAISQAANHLIMHLRVAAERRRSAARDLGLSTPTDFIASSLHRLVLPASHFACRGSKRLVLAA
jgi:hypothetical protein